MESIHSHVNEERPLNSYVIHQWHHHLAMTQCHLRDIHFCLQDKQGKPGIPCSPHPTESNLGPETWIENKKNPSSHLFLSFLKNHVVEWPIIYEKRREANSAAMSFRGPAFFYHSLEPFVEMNVNGALVGMQFSLCSEGDAVDALLPWCISTVGTQGPVAGSRNPCSNEA